MRTTKIILTLLIICIMTSPILSACSVITGASANMISDNSDSRTLLTAGQNDTQIQQPVIYRQEDIILPVPDTLLTYPGIFENMPLTLQQIITVLGCNFELKENKAQGYDTYIFNEYDFSFSFDRLRHKPSAMWVESVPYFINSGDYESVDLNGDGKKETVVVYEDKNYGGKILVADGKSNKTAEAEIGFLGNKSEIQTLTNFGPNKESLIIVKTYGGKRGAIYRYADGKLTDILPENWNKTAKETMVTVEGGKAVVVNKAKDVLYICPLPSRLKDSIKDKSSRDVCRSIAQIRPEVKDGTLNLEIRTHIQVKISDTYDHTEGIEGTFCDVANISQMYQYSGDGKWKEISVDGGPKYESEPVKLFTEDLSVNNILLNSDIDSLQNKLSYKLNNFSSDELNSGVLIEVEGLLIGITNNRISYLSLEKGNLSTQKGLKLSDTRQKALETYGLPDKGFVNDEVWTYYVSKEEQTGHNLSILLDTLQIEFNGDKVCKIWMSSHVTAF